MEVPNVSLNEEEVGLVRKRLGREPNATEWAMIDVMWSEHCSYKSSRKYLKLFPTKGKNVLLGVGDDCGIVKFDDKYGIAIGMESHNHPSAIEPVAGAATGVGGIVRDILSKGAKPIACLDPLRLGDIKTDERSKYLFENIVKGIADYGNCLAGDERVVLRNYGNLEDVEIGKYVDSIIPADMGDVRVTGDFSLDALSFDRRTGDISWKPVKRLFRRKVDTLIEVSTTMGRKIKVSETHPFIVYRDDKWVTKTVTELQKGDELPIMMGLPEGGVVETIDLLSCLKKTSLYNKLSVKCNNPRKYEKRLRPALLKQEPSVYKRFHFFDNGAMNASEFLKLEKASGVSIPSDEFTLHYSMGRCNNIPAKLEINSDLARLIGYYLAEGCVSKNGNTYKIIWTFSKKEREYIDDVCSILKRIGIRYFSYATESTVQIRVSSAILGVLFKEVLKVGTKSHEKRVPEVFLNQPKELRFELLKGLFRGNGSVTLYKNNQVKISFGVTSRELQHQVTLLLQDMGIAPGTGKHKVSDKLPDGRIAKTVHDLNTVEIHNHNDVLKLADLFEKGLSKRIKKALSKHSGKWSFPRYKQREDTFVTVKVTKVEPIEANTSVYDFEVADNHTFVTTGGIITHNCIGVPTIGGEAEFDKSFNGNPLVNVVCIGLVEQDKIVRGIAPNAGDTMMFIGSKTGKDGIHGVTFASEELTSESEEEARPAVQIEDPLSEKLLIDSFMEIFHNTKAYAGCKDLGGGGFSCASSEIVHKGGMGARIDLEKLPLRERSMEPWEMLLSETQERMMCIVKKGQEDEVEKILDKWDVLYSRVGVVTDDGHYKITYKDKTIVDLPTQILTDGPLFDREFEAVEKAKVVKPDISNLEEYFQKLIGDPNIASKKWIYEQYDNEVQLGTVIKPGQDASVIRITDKAAVAIGVGCNSAHCAIDPVEGTKEALSEAIRNITSVGAKPLAAVDCLNFGNPEKPNAFWQFKVSVEALARGLEFFNIPVVSGNVSFYNEADGKSINPSPIITILGKVDMDGIMAMNLKDEGDDIILIGKTHDELGDAPKVDFQVEKKTNELILELIEERKINSAHDLSKGGLAVGLALMAFKGTRGFDVKTARMDEDIEESEKLFSESNGRYVITTKDPGAVLDAAKRAGVKAQGIGKVMGDELSYGPFKVSLKNTKKEWETALEKLLI